ncbi:hypothetical protein JKP88DRAFT_247965 [Tribonema minus]|uniref:Uncharacterized protein n=1 Tax=Tribonema minus TaxID=303371 RepID=A0A835YY31_9STRA|nr:hypothetical protein JKP88DRAFT_247965 [Tribonema minus]
MMQPMGMRLGPTKGVEQSRMRGCSTLLLEAASNAVQDLRTGALLEQQAISAHLPSRPGCCVGTLSSSLSSVGGGDIGSDDTAASADTGTSDLLLQQRVRAALQHQRPQLLSQQQWLVAAAVSNMVIATASPALVYSSEGGEAVSINTGNGQRSIARSPSAVECNIKAVQLVAVVTTAGARRLAEAVRRKAMVLVQQAETVAVWTYLRRSWGDSKINATEGPIKAVQLGWEKRLGVGVDTAAAPGGVADPQQQQQVQMASKDWHDTLLDAAELSPEDKWVLGTKARVDVRRVLDDKG